MMSVCVDAQNCVTGVCPDNLTGGEGWHWMETKLMPSDNLEDVNGVALYKLVNGKVVNREQEEMTVVDPVKTDPERSIEYRVADIESRFKGTPNLEELLEAVTILLEA